MIRALLIPAALLLIAPALWAAPATAPSTLPAADQTTPRGAVMVFARAVLAGEVERVRRCVHATGELEERYAEGFAGMAVAHSRLRSALIGRFGEEQTRGYLEGQSEAEQLEQISSAKEAIIDDRATVELEGQKITLVHVGGEWKLSLTEMLKGKSKEETQRHLKEYQRFIRAYDEVVGEVQAGKHDRIDQALESLKKKFAPPEAAPKK